MAKNGMDAMMESQQHNRPRSCNEYRCTLPSRYSEGTTGHRNVAGRQGHYCNARTPEHAREIMKERFPTEERFDVELWGIYDKEGVYDRTTRGGSL
jgi:hypothetical protein